MTDIVSFEDFKKLELKIGKIKSVEEVEGLDKLYELEVDLGEDKPRTLLAGLKPFYEPYELMGKSIVVVANLEPKEVRGVVSQGMLLAAEGKDNPVLVIPEEEVKPGSTVR